MRPRIPRVLATPWPNKMYPWLFIDRFKLPLWDESYQATLMFVRESCSKGREVGSTASQQFPKHSLCGPDHYRGRFFIRDKLSCSYVDLWLFVYILSQLMTVSFCNFFSSLSKWSLSANAAWGVSPFHSDTTPHFSGATQPEGLHHRRLSYPDQSCIAPFTNMVTHHNATTTIFTNYSTFSTDIIQLLSV